MADFRRRRRRARRVFRERISLLHYRETEIVERFRFSINFIQQLTRIIGDRLNPATARNYAISAEVQVAATLRFLATGAFLRVVGDTVGVSEASMSRIVHRVCRAIVDRLLKPMIKFPKGDKQREVAADFFSKSGFPNVSGAVDGSHIRIISPNNNEGDFVNRKGYHSLNVQMTCDSKFRITSIVSKWPGSVHDSRIFRDSYLSRRFEEGTFNGHLVGDSGYPCLPFLLTPFLNPSTDKEHHFNNALSRARVSIEQTFGILKRRFPILKTGIRMTPEKSSIIITACAILHNLALHHGEVLPDLDEDDIQQDQDQPDNANNQVGGDGAAVRRHICETFF